MDSRTLDAIAREAASVSRRGSLRLLGGAALAGAMMAPAAAGAADKKGQKRCKRQKGQCLAFVEEFCQPKGDPNACETQLSPCCDEFTECHAGQGIECLFDKVFAAAG